MSDPMEIPGGSAQQTLAQRYGTGRSPRRGVVIGVAAGLVLVLLAWALWAGSKNGKPAIDASVTSYDVISDHEVRAKVSAQVRHDADGSCLLRATAEDHTSVGELTLTAAELRRAGDAWIPIRTERRATTVTVVRCQE